MVSDRDGFFLEKRIWKIDAGGAGQERKGPMAMNGHAEGTQPQVRTSDIPIMEFITRRS